MLRTHNNAAAIAAKYRERAEKLTEAVARGLRRVAAAIDRAQVKNLSGAGAPGTYPVPARTGHLRQSHFFTVESDVLAFVGNTARYAIDIHEGRSSSSKYGRRPFLDDAAEAVRAVDEFAFEVRREVLA